MATTALSNRKTSRLDMRLTPEQRKEIEYAAGLKGMSLTQWAVQSLLASARRDVEEETTTRLSMEAFDEFARALGQGMPQEAQDLLARKPVWE